MIVNKTWYTRYQNLILRKILRNFPYCWLYYINLWNHLNHFINEMHINFVRRLIQCAPSDSYRRSCKTSNTALSMRTRHASHAAHRIKNLSFKICINLYGIIFLISIAFIVNFPKYNVTAVSTEDQNSQCPWKSEIGVQIIAGEWWNMSSSVHRIYFCYVHKALPLNTLMIIRKMRFF